MCCGNSILQKGLPFFYLHKIFYTLYFLLFIHICFSYITKTITSFSIFYFFSSLQTLKTVV
ncbi:hypothetical protein FZB85_15140 [Enterococcus faecium]|nr:hypothetical protein [Enterococcus faecium]MCZ1281083.1 hypothetical protein [Enterococcus faecium]MCZ1292314.1 hypothetical protein [Enterococcus faecium]MCZ1426376.1 hypothetical protein [Enterococcus faecium]MCZ1432101.1 hypothetical protein [Enterococcus faecium]